MADLLRQGAQWLSGKRAQHMAGPVAYRRGQTQLTVGATCGQPDRPVADVAGLSVAATVTDFLIAAAELLPTLGEPRPGDQIISDGRVYEALTLDSEDCWRWSGPAGITLRIHTKQVATE